MSESGAVAGRACSAKSLQREEEVAEAEGGGGTGWGKVLCYIRWQGGHETDRQRDRERQKAEETCLGGGWEGRMVAQFPGERR